jgi:serine/threonine-protein kinase
MLTGQAPLTETKDRVQRLTKQRFLDVVPIQQLEPSLPLCVIAAVSKSMSFDPAKRYQTAAAFLADLAAVEAKLLDPQAAAEEVAAAKALSATAGPAAATQAPPESEAAAKFAVMVAESNQKMQDIFRDGLKRVGYRVLVTGDAQRAVSRLCQDNSVADCLLLSAQELAESALQAFNAMGDDSRTRFVRTVLLLGEDQKDWASRAITEQHRVVLTMPITMKQLRTTLAALLARGVTK